MDDFRPRVALVGSGLIGFKPRAARERPPVGQLDDARRPPLEITVGQQRLNAI